jgi:hypothetical protein
MPTEPSDDDPTRGFLKAELHTEASYDLLKWLLKQK